jgi:diacylglycerol kinase family enzyme
MRYFLILNPTAKSGKGKERWEALFQALRAKDIVFEIGESNYPGHAIVLAREACMKNYDVVVAVGGDGTINEVLRGLMSAECTPEARPAMGILYTGTSPDICRYHGIPIDTKGAIHTLLNEAAIATDIGEVQYFSDQSASKPETGYFLCSVNLGVGAAVARGSNSGLRKKFGDFIGTLFSIISSLSSFERPDLSVEIDGQATVLEKTINLTIGKNPYIASGVKVFSDIKHDDGRMYFFAIQRFNFISLLANLHKLYTGNFQKHPNTKFEFIREFSCKYNPKAPEVEFDGDPHGFLPCKIRILHRALKLIKPIGEKS